jgi:hypothetical protein
VPSSDYRLAWIGYYNKSGDGEYLQDTLAGDDSGDDLEILEVRTPDDEQTESNQAVESDGDVPLGEEGSDGLPAPITEPDPEYDDYSITVKTADGSTYSDTVGNVFTEDGMWKLNTDLSEGQSVEEYTIRPPVKYENTAYDATDAANFDPAAALETIKRRRRFNDAVEEQFESGGLIGGGGLFGDGFPTIPGLGALGTVGVAILALFGLNAASSSN